MLKAWLVPMQASTELGKRAWRGTVGGEDFRGEGCKAECLLLCEDECALHSVPAQPQEVAVLSWVCLFVVGEEAKELDLSIDDGFELQSSGEGSITVGASASTSAGARVVSRRGPWCWAG